jgi:hypothetical protein
MSRFWGRRLAAAALLILVMIFGLAPRLQYPGANQSDDPCFKIKKFKQDIIAAPGYKQLYGKRDPAYVKCYPLNIFLTWKLEDSVDTRFGRGWITFILNEEYPAYLMLHYFSFDRLKKNDLWTYEIAGPEPCELPCPGRVKAELADLSGQAIICMDYYQNCKPKVFELDSLKYDLNPIYKNSQEALFFVQWQEGKTSGQISSSEMNARADVKPKGRGIVAWTSRYWDKENYKIELNGTGINTNSLRHLSLKSDWPAEEIFEGMRTGLMTKVLKIDANEPPFKPGESAYSLKGTLTVKIAFAPIQEERWRITVKAHEKDTTKPPYVFSDPKGKSLQAAVRADFDVALAAEFVVRKIKNEWEFKEGKVTQAEVAPSFTGIPLDLFQCTIKECAGKYGIPAMMGNNLEGTIEGKKIELHWAPAQATSQGKRTSACVFCKPSKSSMKNVPYKQEFGSGELVYNLNSEFLPLQSGLTVNRKVGDFLTYTITLVKIK